MVCSVTIEGQSTEQKELFGINGINTGQTMRKGDSGETCSKVLRVLKSGFLGSGSVRNGVLVGRKQD